MIESYQILLEQLYKSYWIPMYLPWKSILQPFPQPEHSHWGSTKPKASSLAESISWPQLSTSSSKFPLVYSTWTAWLLVVSWDDDIPNIWKNIDVFCSIDWDSSWKSSSWESKPPIYPKQERKNINFMFQTTKQWRRDRRNRWIRHHGVWDRLFILFILGRSVGKPQLDRFCFHGKSIYQWMISQKILK